MSKPLINILLFISIFGLESFSILIVLSEEPLLIKACYAFIMHLGACLIVSLIFPKFLTNKNQASRMLTSIFFFSFAFFTPVLGILGLILVFIPGLQNKKNLFQENIIHTKIRKLTDVVTNHSYRPTIEFVDLENLLYSHNPEKRMKAVYATLKLDDKIAIPLLKMALRDPVDDIRLLAYELIDRKEHRINERIEDGRLSLENNLYSDRQHIYESMANDYWELAHVGLIEGETKNFILNKSREYIEKGLQLYPQDRGLHFLYAKLLLKLGELQAAYDEFKLSEELGISNHKLLLYYAEIDFKLRRYRQVQENFKETNFASARSEIIASAHFWLEVSDEK